MNDLTLNELNTLVAVFEKASELNSEEQSLFDRIKSAQSEREELENMDFDDCVGGACKL